MKGNYKHNISVTIILILLWTVPILAAEINPCPPPKKVSFEIKKKDMKFADQYQGYIPLPETQEIIFVPHIISYETSTIVSSSTVTWDFGDKKSIYPQIVSRPVIFSEQTHTYEGGKNYTIILSASNTCNERKSTVSKYSKTVYISGSRSDGIPILEGFASCNRYSDIPESAIATLNEESLIYLIRSLRNDIRARQEVIDRVKEVRNELKRVSAILKSNPDIREKEMQKFNLMVDKAEGLISQSTEENNLQSIKDMLKTDMTQTFNAEDFQQLTDWEISTEKSIIKQCNSTLAVLEGRVRRIGNRLIKQINELEALSQMQEFNKDKWTDYDADLAGKKDRKRKIDRVTRLTADDLFQTFDDYQQYFFKFTIGYSYTMVSKVFQEGKPIVGFVVYRRTNNNEIADSEHGWAWPFRYGAHLKFAALFSGSGEQATAISDPPPAVTNPGNNNSVGFNEEVFLPLHRSERFNNKKLWEYFGPVALIGVNITQKDEENSVDNTINTRLYGGLKFAINPELYADILYGRTSGLYSKRLELRAQLPVHRFTEGSRFFLGAVANFGVKDKVANEADSFSIYMTWNVNFDAVFSYFTGKQIDDTTK